MEALDSSTSSTDPTMRTGSDVVGRHFSVALGGVAGVGLGDECRIDLRFGAAHSTTGLEPAHCQDLALADQPVARRHRLSAIQQGRVAEHNGRTSFVTHDDLEGTTRRSADQLADGGDIVAHVISDG